MSSDSNTLKSVILSLGLYHDSGGPLKTIRCFQDALNASLVSFVDAERAAREQIAMENALEVRSVPFPPGRQLLYPQASDSRIASKQIRNAAIVSCHSYYRFHIPWLYRQSMRYDIPYWFVPHGILDPWVLSNGAISKKIFTGLAGRAFLKRASTMIFSTHAERVKAAKHYPVGESEVIPWPVKPVDITGKSETRYVIRKRYGIPHDALLFVYFGRIHSMKRPLETIKALSRMKSKQAHLIMIGNENDIQRDELQACADSEGMTQRFQYLGPMYHEEKFACLQASDAYISLSHRENFNHTAAEALGCGTPVLLSPGNDLAGELSDWNCSLTWENDTMDAAVEALNHFSELSESARSEMGRNGHRFVSEKLSFAEFQTSLQNLVKRYGR